MHVDIHKGPVHFSGGGVNLHHPQGSRVDRGATAAVIQCLDVVNQFLGAEAPIFFGSAGSGN